MPYSTIIPVLPRSLRTIVDYLPKQAAPSHAEYTLTPVRCIGCRDAKDFIRKTLAGFDRNNRRTRRGRKAKSAANWFIVRTSDGTDLTQAERATYEIAVMDEIEHAHSAVALLNWHRNKLTKSEDLNVLAAGFSATGILVRDKQRDPIRRLRRAMDAVTEGLNELRQERGCPLIQTMQEVQQRNRAERGEPDIVEQLRQLPRRPKKPDELKAALLSLGCEITRFNVDRDTMSVKKPGRKKASRMSISALLQAIEDAKPAAMSTGIQAASEESINVPNEDEADPADIDIFVNRDGEGNGSHDLLWSSGGLPPL